MSNLRTLLGPLFDHIQFEPNSGCWLWDGSWDRDGYGRAWFQGKVIRAHQVVYRILKGKPRRGSVHDHLCNVRACCNPDHLEHVSQACNCRRRESRKEALAGSMLPDNSKNVNQEPER